MSGTVAVTLLYIFKWVMTSCMYNKTRIRQIVFRKYFRYTDKEGQLFCQLLDLVSIPHGMARPIAEAVMQVIIKKEMPQDCTFGLGTDGAAVMTGKVNE